MRADLEELLRRLIDLHRRKLELLKKLSRLLTDKRYYLKIEDTERLSATILEDIAVIETIDSVDFEIGSTLDRMVHITGSDKRQLEDIFQKSNPTEASGLNKLRRLIRSLLEESLRDNDELVQAMEKLSCKTQFDLRTFGEYLKILSKN